jgi:hypothetical protein
MSELENANWVNKYTSLLMHSTPGNETELPEILETNIRNARYPVKYCFQSEYFTYKNERIPVINFHTKDFLPLRYYPVKALNQDGQELTRMYEYYKGILLQQHEVIEKRMIKPVEMKTCLPAYIVDLIIQDHLQKKESCPITLNEFTDASHMAVTSCYHCFDMEALKEWVKTKDACPVCRTKL